MGDHATLGAALREIGSGPVKVMLRVQDMAMRVDPEKGIGGVGQELVAFEADDFREIGGDVWAFTINASDGAPGKRIYCTGADLVMVEIEPRVGQLVT